MSFDARVFVEEKFDCEKFITDLRKDGTSLEDLSVSLEAFVEKLNGSLVSMIEKEYSAFLKLSAMLVNIDSMVAVLKEPIEHVVARVDELSTTVKAPFDEQRDLMLQLHAVRYKRKLLELNLSAWESLRKVEVEVERLRQGEDCGENSSGIGEVKISGESSRPADLERAAQRLAMVTFLTRQGEHHDMPLLRHIKARTRGLQQALTEQLEVAFGLEIVPDNFNNLENNYVNADALCRVLRSYVAINQIDLAHAVFRKLLVMPFLDRSFTVGRLDGGERGSCRGLGGMYEDVIKFVVKVCKPIFEVLANPEWGLSSQFDFMGSGIGLAVQEALSTKLSQVYSSGVADTLHYTYSTTEAFFQILETLSSKPEVVATIMKETLGRWNLSVYKQLRRKEMVADVEEKISAGSIEVVTGGDSSIADMRLPPTRALWLHFKRCDDPEQVFLQPVALDLFKVKLELLQVYCEWVKASADAETSLQCWENLPFKMRIHVAKDAIALKDRLREDVEQKRTLNAMFPSNANTIEGKFKQPIDRLHRTKEKSSTCEQRIRAGPIPPQRVCSSYS